MRTFLFSAVACAAMLSLAGCGGGGGSSDNRGPVASHSDFPLTTGDIHYVGVDQGGDYLNQLPTVGQRSGTTMRYGTLRDGVGREAVAAYLREAQGMSARRFTSAPSLRIIGPATARERQLVADAVEAINLSLPTALEIEIGEPRPNYSLQHTVSSGGFGFYRDDVPGDSIYIEFLPCADYHDCGGAVATTWAWLPNRNQWSYVQMPRGTRPYGVDRDARLLLAHEILHAIGIDQHVSRRFDSIMVQGRIFWSGPASLLQRVDREALQALYTRLEPGDDPTAFGPWASTSTHLAGNGQNANFGVAFRNGYAEPWAHGPMPSTTLANNRSLSGSATWTGTLLGLTPAAEAVAGDAEIDVQLATLTGRADFTSLETWVANVAPGAAGTGATWLDGDLGYSIAVSGNTFRETGGDAGVLTGIFTGALHEGAAGTLERADLTAAFGASRE